MPDSVMFEKDRSKLRPVKTLTGTVWVRKITPSKEAIKALGLRTKRNIVGHMALNPQEIDMQTRMLRVRILREMAAMSELDRMKFCEVPIDFVKDKGNRKKFFVICTTCHDRVAYVWADNEKLENWCDLHYLCWYDRESSHGAMAVNVSPVDGELGFECACGEDTRDFRVNKTMPPIQKRLMIEYAMKHRGFGTKDSKFIAIEDV